MTGRRRLCICTLFFSVEGSEFTININACENGDIIILEIINLRKVAAIELIKSEATIFGVFFTTGKIIFVERLCGVFFLPQMADIACQPSLRLRPARSGEGRQPRSGLSNGSRRRRTRAYPIPGPAISRGGRKRPLHQLDRRRSGDPRRSKCSPAARRPETLQIQPCSSPARDRISNLYRIYFLYRIYPLKTSEFSCSCIWRPGDLCRRRQAT